MLYLSEMRGNGAFKMINKIIHCELAYSRCFSKEIKTVHGIRFTDSELLDMYDHNYTYLPKISTNILTQEVLDCFKTQDFCKLVSYEPPIDSIPNGEISLMGVYQFDWAEVLNLKDRDDLVIEVLKQIDTVADLIACDLAHDEQTLGYDFCVRRATRRKNVYLSNDGVDCYIAYYKGHPIGKCDLFIHDEIAKIEDFGVNPCYQHQGFGTAILKSMIETAIQQNCQLIYLVTDEEDTAKDMYQKLGFHKIAQRTDYFFKRP